jgi:serine/threonine protein kinase
LLGKLACPVSKSIHVAGINRENLAHLRIAVDQSRIDYTLGTVVIDSGFYLIEEFIEGTPLSLLIARKAFTSNRSRRDEVIRSVCRSLQQIHRRKVAWRDLKPQNMILRNRHAVFVDFELAVRVPARERFNRRGTVGYLPPEWNRPSTGTQSLAYDVYALGVTLGLMCGGRLVKGGSFAWQSRSAIDRRYAKLVEKMIHRIARLRPNAKQIFQAVVIAQKPRRKAHRMQSYVPTGR